MSKLETITDKIIARADAELKNQIETAIEPMCQLFRSGHGHKLDFGAFTIEWYQIIEPIKTTLFNIHRDKNRQRAINEFTAKVESLSEQVEQLQHDISQ